MDGKRSPKTRRLGFALLAIVLIGILWHQLRRSPAPSAPSTSAKVAVQPDIQSKGNPPGAVTQKAGAVKAPTARQTIICGVGAVEIDASQPTAAYDYVDRLTAAAQTRWRQSLLDSDDARLRAAGLLQASQGWQPDPVTNVPTRTPEALLAREELVQLAAGLSDLQIYVMAVRACDSAEPGEDRGAACKRISVAEWTSRDPDNVAPWLELAAQAHANGDKAAEVDAMSHAAAAHQVNFYNDSVLPAAIASTPEGTSDLARAAFTGPMIGHVGSDGMAHAYAAHTYCSVSALDDAAVRGQCESLADLLAGKARNTADLSAASIIGAHLGWPADKITAMQQEMLATFRVESGSGPDPWSCDNVRGINTFAGIQAKNGELAAGRAAIQKSGKSIAELAQEQIDVVKPGISFTDPSGKAVKINLSPL